MGPRRMLAAVLAIAATGCVSVARVENQALERYQPGAGYGSMLATTPYSEKLRVVLAFSGGGTRASALAYGALKELRDTPITLAGDEAQLLDAVSTISSVSGGSFTAAYYGLYGDRIFDDYEERFLRLDIDARLAVNLLRPFKLLRLMFTRYSRSDMAMDVYDKHVFGGATFADLAKAGGPVLNINATDIDVGAVFTFMQPTFNMICSDLSKLRVATAVTASSAVPGVFAPIVLENNTGNCGCPEPEWIREALANPSKSRRRHHDAKLAATYLDRSQRPYLFMLDGGVADNIGVRRILADVIVSGGLFDLAEREHIQMPETVVYVIVNAQAGGKHDWSKKQSLPSITSVLGSISSVGIYRYNFETIELLREEAAEWSKQAARHGKHLNTYVVEVAFDPPERSRGASVLQRRRDQHEP